MIFASLLKNNWFLISGAECMIRDPWVVNMKVGRVKDKNAEVRFLSFLSIQRINFLGHDI